jgi:hypothetical protein
MYFVGFLVVFEEFLILLSMIIIFKTNNVLL